MVTDNRSPDATSDGLAERNTTKFIWASYHAQSRAPNDRQAEEARRYLDRHYAIETARLTKLAELKTERDFHESEATRKQAAPAQTAASPAPVADTAPGGVSWTPVKPQRFQGYGKPLHDLLKAAHIDGKPCPTARDVLDTWRDKMPPEVMEVMTDGLKYYDAKGDAKPADLNAIRKAIGRMTR